MLLIPDLVGYWLTGGVAAEETNASTTGLLDPAVARLGRRRSSTSSGCAASLFPALRRARARRWARCATAVAAETGLAPRARP